MPSPGWNPGGRNSCSPSASLRVLPPYCWPLHLDIGGSHNLLATHYLFSPFWAVQRCVFAAHRVLANSCDFPLRRHRVGCKVDFNDRGLLLSSRNIPRPVSGRPGGHRGVGQQRVGHGNRCEPHRHRHLRRHSVRW